MDQKDAIRIVVEMATKTPETTPEGLALRLILRELKDRRQGDAEMNNWMAQMDEMLEGAGL